VTCSPTSEWLKNTRNVLTFSGPAGGCALPSGASASISWSVETLSKAQYSHTIEAKSSDPSLDVPTTSFSATSAGRLCKFFHSTSQSTAAQPIPVSHVTPSGPLPRTSDVAFEAKIYVLGTTNLVGAFKVFRSVVDLTS
jgi:hypothetical protein